MMPSYSSSYLKLILTVILTAFITACSTTSNQWKERYDDIETQVMRQYTDMAEKLDNDPYTYHFELEAAHLPFVYHRKPTSDKSAESIPNDFILHANYTGQHLVELDQFAIAALEQQIKPLKQLSDVRVHVIGHSDNVPLSLTTKQLYKNNEKLSEARAKEVADYLKKTLKLKEHQVSYTGVGDKQPITSNATVEGRAENRRVAVNVKAEPPQVKISPVIKSDNIPDIPDNVYPWWRDLVSKPFNAEHEDAVYITQEDLLLRALKNSSQIKVFSDLPLIRRTSIKEAQARFDMHAFAEAMYADIDEPIGSTLKTGERQGRFEEHEWRLEGGVRQPFKTGGELELSQRIGVLDNNSRYLVPHDQAHARLALTFRQPLLKGAWTEYNEATIEIAKVDYDIALDEFVRQVSAHLLEVERSYWSLALERAMLLQKKRLLDSTRKVVEELEARRGLDALESHLMQAKAALTEREADSIRYEQSVRNAEAKLISLINDPELIMSSQFELIPTSIPKEKGFDSIEMRQSVIRALQHRPEIKQAFKQMKASLIRADRSKQELKPILDFMLETYLSGLEGNSDTAKAIDNEFTIGGPSYIVGLKFDYPLGNRSAEARYERRRIETRQLINQLRTTIDTVLLEVQVSVREVDTALRELKSKYQAMLAALKELDTIKARRSLISDVDLQTHYLQRLLDAQARLTEAEGEFLTSFIAYNIAHSHLRRAEGMFLEVNELEVIEDKEETYDEEELPVLKVQPQSERTDDVKVIKFESLPIEERKQ